MLILGPTPPSCDKLTESSPRISDDISLDLSLSCTVELSSVLIVSNEITVELSGCSESVDGCVSDEITVDDRERLDGVDDDEISVGGRGGADGCTCVSRFSSALAVKFCQGI